MRRQGNDDDVDDDYNVDVDDDVDVWSGIAASTKFTWRRPRVILAKLFGLFFIMIITMMTMTMMTIIIMMMMMMMTVLSKGHSGQTFLITYIKIMID